MQQSWALEMELVTRVQILDEAVCVTLCAKMKGTNLSLLSQALSE